MIERVPRLLVLFLIFVEFAQLLVISRRGIIQDLRLQSLNAGPPPESLKHAAKKSQIGDHLRDDINCAAYPTAEKNDVEPVVLRTPPHEVQDRQALHDEAPRIEKVAQSKHG